MKYYAVHKGKKTGVFNTWDECKKMIIGYKGAKYKKFNILEDARDFVKNGLLIKKMVNNTIDKYFCKKEDKIDDKIEDTIKDKIDHKIDHKIEDKIIHKIYTDGSCYGNGETYSLGGYGIYVNDNKYYIEPLNKYTINENKINENMTNENTTNENITNNIAELKAILKVFELFLKELKNGDIIEIITDSDYSIRAFTTYGQKCNDSFWRKDIPNKELIKKGFKIVKKYPNIKFTHIHSHTGKKDINSINNEKVDLLAKKGLLIAIQKSKNLGNFKFKIGKYKNETIESVFKKNKSYIKWFLNNNISNKTNMFRYILHQYIS